VLRIAICTPCYGDVTAEYSYSLAKLVLRTGQTQVDFNGKVVSPQIEIFMRSSSVLPQLRNMLLKSAIEWGANYLLWLDADQKFPDDALLRLLSLNLPVVGVNYPRRVPPHLPTASSLDGKLVTTTEEAAKANEVVPVASLGFGCCLIDMTIFEKLHEHALATGEAGIWPLFAVEMVGDGTEIVGEDVFFFRRLRDAGVPVHLDQALSWAIGHVHQSVLTNADTYRPWPLDKRTTTKVEFDGLR
jgi:hypothetical protein